MNIKEILERMYLVFYIPFCSVIKYMFILGSVVLFVSSLTYGLLFKVFLKSDFLKVDRNDVSKIVDWKPKTNTMILDNSGAVISEQFNQYHQYVPYKKIPPTFINAIVSIEDRNFFKHSGFDIGGIFRAVVAILKNNRTGYRQGASTITQQVVKNLLLTNEKTISRKIREIVLSIYLETMVSKEKIIEIYSNQMFLGNGSYGVGAASKRYFGRELHTLDIHEVAVLAGLFQLPSFYNPSKFPNRAKKRQEKVLLSMLKNGYLSQNNYNHYLSKELIYKEYSSLHGTVAPYFVDYVSRKSEEILEKMNYKIKDSGLKIYTTLDLKLQKLAEKSFIDSQNVFKYAEKNLKLEKNRESKGDLRRVEAAMLVVNHKTAEIVAMVGGRDYEENQFNRASDALRAPGSIFKTITYSYALSRGKNWNDMYYIAPLTVGNYRPHTSSEEMLKETTMLSAFYKSINSVAVELGVKLGLNRVLRYAKKLGVETQLKKEASTLLGSSEVTMLDVARTYSTFANGGVRVDPIVIHKIINSDEEVIYLNKDLKKRSKRVVSKLNAALVSEGLKKVVERGTAYKAISLSGFVGGKTGTSNKSRDNWFAGYSKDLTTVVWVGNDNQNAFKGYVSASNTAVPLWKKFMKPTISLLKTPKLSTPDFLQKVKIHPQFGRQDKEGVAMYFPKHFKIKNTAPLDIEYLLEGKKLRAGFD